MARPSKKDIETSVHKTKKSNVKTESTMSAQPDDEAIYDKLGTKVDALASDQIMAKFARNNGINRYFVKTNIKGELWNPKDQLFVDESYRSARTYARTDVYKLVSTNIECFNNYVKFLQTGVGGYLTKAQRELGS